MTRQRRTLMFALAGAVFLQWGYWFASSDVHARWAGVPPVPSKPGAVMMTLGDPQLSYRSGALTLQNLGDNGGQVTALKDYSYEMLGDWFKLLHGLDPASNHVPMAAAYYFGATRIPKDVRVIVDYLSRIGQNPAGDKWRWLAHATYLARHRLNDLELALDLAYKLSRMQPVGDELPIWARQMPAFVLKARGDREDARALMENMLATDKNLDATTINFLKGYLVEQLGMTPQEVEAAIKMRGTMNGPAVNSPAAAEQSTPPEPPKP